jgi:hypothetical protein
MTVRARLPPDSNPRHAASSDRPRGGQVRGTHAYSSGLPCCGAAAAGPVGRGHSGCRDRNDSRSGRVSDHLYRKSYHGPDRGNHVRLAGLATGAVGDLPLRAKHKRRRRPAYVEATHQVKPRLRVDLDVRNAVHHLGDVGENPPRRPAGRAEGGRELHERRPAAKLRAEFVRRDAVQCLAPHRSAAGSACHCCWRGRHDGTICLSGSQRSLHPDPAIARAPHQPGHRRGQERASTGGQSSYHGRVNVRPRRHIPARARDPGAARQPRALES